MVNVQDVFTLFCNRLLEVGGNFTDGTFSQQNFLLYCADVINDMTWRTGISCQIFTQPIMLGQATYAVPATLTRVLYCFIGGKYIPKKTQEELDALYFSWRTTTGMPAAWWEDGLPNNTIGVYPTPNYNGPTYNVASIPPGVTGAINPLDQNLTMVGPQIPATAALTIGSTISILPDSAMQYVSWGCLAKAISDDSENRNLELATYCQSRYQEGLNLLRAIALEALLGETDDTAGL